MFINQQYLNSQISSFEDSYAVAQPFSHVCIDAFLNPNYGQKLSRSFPKVADKVWTHYIHYNERKHGLTKWDHFPEDFQKLFKQLSEAPFISWLENLTGINHLFADPHLEGSGLHQTLAGGFLNIHADFTAHPKNNKWRRRVNVLIYLNNDWKSEWGGELEFWNENMSQRQTVISPIFNRAVIFGTGSHTFHGYPQPLQCPEGESRKSIAMYYYTEETDFIKKATGYKPRPEDGFKSVFIFADTMLISVYSKLKGLLGWNDDTISAILNIFHKSKSKNG